MKKTNICSTILIIFGALFNYICYSQTYSYSQKEESLRVKTLAGETKYVSNKKQSGEYKFIHEKSSRGDVLFTIYEDGIEEQWYGRGQVFDYKELNGKIFSHERYLATKDNEEVAVLMSQSKDEVLIFFSNRMIHYKR